MPVDVYEMIGDGPIPHFDKLYYTFCHRRAVRYVLDNIFSDSPVYDDLDYRADIHDLDKCLYLALGGDKERASAYHRANARHHMESNASPNQADLIEAIIDYESAGYTKADKPLNAYDTVLTWDKPHARELISMMGRYDMARSYQNTPDDPDWIAWNGGYEPDEADMLAQLDMFCKCEPDWAERIASAAGI